jgi:nucleoside-diphosphate-sugar epimerase
MRIFLTGATGFIGSHVVNQALAAGDELVPLKHSATSQPRIPLAVEPKWLTKAMPEVVESDFASCDVVLHLAAHSANHPYDTLENCLQWNLMVPLNFFRVAQRAGIQRFVVAGSCFEYGRAGERYKFIPPDAPLEPTLSYPTSKAAASVAFVGYAAETKAQLSIHRIFQVFGEGESPSRLWPAMRRAALAGEDYALSPGDQVRDFVPVEEVAAKLLAACADSSVEPGVAQIRNLGTGHPQTIREFAEYWWTKWKATGELKLGALPYRPGEVMRYVPLTGERATEGSSD